MTDKVARLLQNGTGSSQEAGSQGGLPESEGAFILPYNAFRRLRLDNIRHSLGMGKAHQQLTQGSLLKHHRTWENK